MKKLKKCLDIITKEYLSLKTFVRKNNFFAIISKKIYEIPNFIKKTFTFLGTLKRRFITNTYKRIKKNISKKYRGKNRLKNIIINVKKRMQLNKPTGIEKEALKQLLALKQTIYKFRLCFGIFNFKRRRLIRTKLRQFFYKYDYKYDFEEYKVENRMYRWQYRAKRPRVKNKLWKKLLKKMHFNKKKLFKYIKRFKLIKKLNVFDIIVQRCAYFSTIKTTKRI